TGVVAASKDLIAELKAELAAQATTAKERIKLEKKVEDHESTIASLQQKITELTTALSSSKAENKTLSTKLAASRSAEAALAKAPGNAVKANGTGMRNGVNSGIIQTAQMKEDLYSDLTGLIVRGVKTDDKEDVYDCLQTGKNGSESAKWVRNPRAEVPLTLDLQPSTSSSVSRLILAGTDSKRRRSPINRSSTKAGTGISSTHSPTTSLRTSR